MDEIGIMIEKAHLRLHAAKELFDPGLFDDSVNRSYYSMVMAASAALRCHDVIPKTHRGLHRKFSELFIKSGEIDARLGKNFHSALDLRDMVDYAPYDKVDEEQAEVILENATDFLEKVEKLIESISK